MTTPFFTKPPIVLLKSKLTYRYLPTLVSEPHRLDTGDNNKNKIKIITQI